MKVIVLKCADEWVFYLLIFFIITLYITSINIILIVRCSIYYFVNILDLFCIISIFIHNGLNY